MIAIVMLRSGFKPGFGLGKHFQGIVEPIKIPTKGAKFGLEYVPVDDEAEMRKKNVDQALSRPIPHLYQSFPVREYVNDDGLGEGIWDLFEEIDVTYFPDKEVAFVGEDISEAYPGWRVFFDGAANHQGKGIGAVLVSEIGQHYPMAAKLQFNCTNNMAEYKACILGLNMAIDINIYELLVIGDSDLLIHQVQGEWVVKNLKITPYV
ncbi:hypothetical protein R3W88_015071 [Solanum pinnatisectum]|uniref:G-patch domain-containing protein n=1 Tax=Solanum pinnatisectum TaxID=50273 RepID=A0AAV9KU78_9SOLN|nr:hypothetical protein R3W88_015071 [Solanum pinnatisectum]